MLGRAMTAVVTTATATFNTITTDDIGAVANGFFTNFNLLSATGPFSLKLGESQTELSLATTDLPLQFEGTCKEIYLQSASTVVTISMLAAVIEPTVIG